MAQQDSNSFTGAPTGNRASRPALFPLNNLISCKISHSDSHGLLTGWFMALLSTAGDLPSLIEPPWTQS